MDIETAILLIKASNDIDRQKKYEIVQMLEQMGSKKKKHEVAIRP